MIWGYLTEFWDSITNVVVGGITYTIEWFEGIGNAVAGAIGGLFDDLIHHIYDVFLLFSWLFDELSNIFNTIFTPLIWLFNFSKGFLASATLTLDELGLAIPEFEIYNENIDTFINSIPYFTYLLAGGGALMGLFFVIIIIKRASRI